MKKQKTFVESVNWEWVSSHQKTRVKLATDPVWIQSIIEHARRNGYTGKITPLGAARIINASITL